MYHIPTASLQRGQILSVNSFSSTKVEYLVQYDSLELGHALVSDDLIAIHGDVPIRLRRKKLYEKESNINNNNNNGNLSTQLLNQDNLTLIGFNDSSSSSNTHFNDQKNGLVSQSLENANTQDSIFYLSSIHQELWDDSLKESREIFKQALRGVDSISNTTPQLPSLVSRGSGSGSGISGSSISSSGPTLIPSSIDPLHSQSNSLNQQEQQQLPLYSHGDALTNSILESLIIPLLSTLVFINNLSSSKLEQSNLKSSHEKDNIFTQDIQNFITYKIQEVYPATNLYHLHELFRKYSQLQVEFPSIWTSNPANSSTHPSPLLPSVFSSGYNPTNNQHTFPFPSSNSQSTTQGISYLPSTTGVVGTTIPSSSLSKNLISNTPLTLSLPSFESSSFPMPQYNTKNSTSSTSALLSLSSSSISKE